MQAFVLAKIGRGFNREKVMEKLLSIDEVREVMELTGDIDLLVRVDVLDVERLMKTVLKIRSVESIATTDTRVVLSVERAGIARMH
ncbi:MAG: Lrp/AsnC ligand binding domain-containing protein [Candidatus Brockarchaeota archaeon]|nr:Lrp/AsnC ligand binding domain-containing protein [Candidatus Brockarchaeota archaeon]MBO3809281.1 Lrp/AsnC ligand binding domain-containing protein [Candidatus Brockarchaeota archaeon]